MALLPRILTFAALCLLGIFIALAPIGASGCAGASTGAGEAIPNPERAKIWVYFADHGERSSAELRALMDRTEIGARARARRLRRSDRGSADLHDLPVHGPYIEALRVLGCDVRHESRYFNAVSAWVDSRQLGEIASLRFVRRTEPVRTGKRSVPIEPVDPWIGRVPLPEASRGGALEGESATGFQVDYGLSALQNRQINTPPLHAEGYHGEGVRIAVLDTGFFLGHSAFATLNVVAEWDFINDDSITADEFGEGSRDIHGQMGHGTASLGVLASNWPGRVMGTAWAAEYILAKTERLIDEVRIEEDDYVAALEWADWLGVDVVSSSLGYYYWYDYEDMDGNTAISTKAVDIAASRGILVVTAAGNEGGFPWPTLIAPADADSAITVGATDSLGQVTAFSSRGPTFDGRIKPDVVALGKLVVAVNWQDPQGLAAHAGTSASTPLVAGACALILQKHPDWSPIRVRDALRATASHADAPNNDHGWGVIDAMAASEHRGTISVVLEARVGSCGSPFNPKSQGVLPTLLLGSEALDVGEIDVGTLRLAGVAALRGRVADLGGPGGAGACVESSPDGRDDLLLTFRAAEIADAIGSVRRGDRVPLELTGALHDGTLLEGLASARIVGEQAHPTHAGGLHDAMAAPIVAGAHPNPFHPATRISYRVPEATHVSLAVYDVSGRRVASLVDALQPAGGYSMTWDASGRQSGVYFYRLSIGDVVEQRRVILVR